VSRPNRQPKWLTASEQKAWRAYLLATHLVDERLDRQLQRDAQMPHAYYGILVGLSEAPDRSLRMSVLARRLRYSQSRLTHAIASMERKGWVERRDCTTDRRGQIVCVTKQGVAALAAAAPGHVSEVRAAVFDRLSAEQVAQLTAICTQIAEGLDDVAASAGIAGSDLDGSDLDGSGRIG
jgi:DNA-binding MarR family transcriptional regulator